MGRLRFVWHYHEPHMWVAQMHIMKSNRKLGEEWSQPLESIKCALRLPSNGSHKINGISASASKWAIIVIIGAKVFSFIINTFCILLYLKKCKMKWNILKTFLFLHISICKFYYLTFIIQTLLLIIDCKIGFTCCLYNISFHCLLK